MKSYSDLTDAELAERLAYEGSLYLFAKHCLGYKDMIARTHLPIAEALQSTTKRKLLCLPRGIFKSSLATIAYPMWCLIHNPNLRIMIDSEIYTNAKNFLREIAAHYVRNEKFRHLFGDEVGPLWNEGEIIIKSRTKPLKEASIFCSGIGAGKTGAHMELIVADDLSSYINTKNPEIAQKTIDHYRLYQSLLEPDGTIVVIGTRYSEIDVIGFIMETELGIKDNNINELKKIYATRANT